MASGVAPALNARITSSRRTRLLPTRKTPGGSSRSGTATVRGSKSSVVIEHSPGQRIFGSGRLAGLVCLRRVFLDDRAVVNLSLPEGQLDSRRVTVEAVRAELNPAARRALHVNKELPRARLVALAEIPREDQL